MSQSIEGMSKKDFFLMVALAAEAASDDQIIQLLEFCIQKYKKAKEFGKSGEELKIIFSELTTICYINIARLVGKDAVKIIKEIETIDRVYTLIQPPSN